METQRVEVFSASEGKLLIQFFIFHIPWDRSHAEQRHPPIHPPGPQHHPAASAAAETLPSDQLVLLTLPACVSSQRENPREGDRKVLISVSRRYRDGPGNKWPNAQAAEETINKAIPHVITVPLFLKLTFQNFSLCKSPWRHH